MLLAGFYARFGKEQEAIREAEAAMRLRPNDNRILYNAACTFGVLNKKAESLSFLKKAVETGYLNRDWLLRDPDLACLRVDAEFEQIFKEQAKA